MNSFTHNITTIDRVGDMFRKDHLEESGIHGRQYSLILNLVSHPGISQEELSQRTYLNKSNVARQLVQLEEAGFVTRRFSEDDKRIQLVFPTEKARLLAPQILKTHQQWREFLDQGFTPEEIETFTTLLDRMAQRARQYGDQKNTKK